MPRPKKKKVIAIDFETVADKSVIPFLPEVKAKANLKDPEKIAADIAEKERQQIIEMGLDPNTNIICCAGWASDKGSGCLSLTRATYEEEKKLLLDLWDILVEYEHFVTFNGRSFDIRCLYLHGISHGIRPAVNIDKGKYNRPGSNHTDLREVFFGAGAFAKGKMGFAAQKYLGKGKTEGIDGAAVQSFFDLGMYEEINEYCVLDAELELELYYKADIAGLLE